MKSFLVIGLAFAASIALLGWAGGATQAIGGMEAGTTPWSTPIKLINADAPEVASAFDPRLIETSVHDEVAVTVDPYDHIHVLWASRASTADDSPPALFYSQWDGINWTPAIDVLVEPNNNTIYWPVLASGPDGELYACWKGTNALLYFSHAASSAAITARGWAAIKPISNDQVMHSDMKVDALGRVHVLYAANADVYYIHSQDKGVTWSMPVNVSHRPSGVVVEYPRLAIDGRGRLHAVWTDYTAPQGEPILGAFYAQSIDNGQTWSLPLQITPGRDYAEINVVAMGMDEVHLAWNGRAEFGGRYHQWSADGGRTWSHIEEIIPRTATGGGRTGPPDAAVDSAGTLHLVSGMNPGGVMYLSWKGGQWSEPYLIESPSGWAEKARIVVSEGNRLNVFWQEWYTMRYTDAPHTVTSGRPIAPPTETPVLVRTVQLTPTVARASAQNVDKATPTFAPRAVSTAAEPVLLGIAPVVLLVIVVVVGSLILPGWRSR